MFCAVCVRILCAPCVCDESDMCVCHLMSYHAFLPASIPVAHSTIHVPLTLSVLHSLLICTLLPPSPSLLPSPSSLPSSSLSLLFPLSPSTSSPPSLSPPHLSPSLPSGSLVLNCEQCVDSTIPRLHGSHDLSPHTAQRHQLIQQGTYVRAYICLDVYISCILFVCTNFMYYRIILFMQLFLKLFNVCSYIIIILYRIFFSTLFLYCHIHLFTSS